MTVPDALDAAAVRRWARLAADGLERHQDEIDRLNVFPIPDRDTGTNMALTARSGDASARAVRSETAGAVLAGLAGGAVLGARGNSGVILAQLLRGLAAAVTGRTVVDPRALKAALAHAVEGAYGAVGDPVEGTMLTVARCAAQAAAVAPDTIAGVVGAALAGARTASAATTGQLDALRRAGVVDAGGRGLVVVLEALGEAVRGEAPPKSIETTALPAEASAAPTETGAVANIGPAVTGRDVARDSPAYEVQYLLEAGPAEVERLRAELDRLGDSLAIADGGDGHWNVHVHVDDAGAAIEAGVRAGRPYRIEVTRFADRPAQPPRGAGPVGAGRGGAHPGVSLVAIGPAAGLAEVFAAEGVRVVEAGASGPPSEDDVLAAIRAAGTGSIVLLPDPDQPVEVPERAAANARARGLVVAILPTRSAVQALAAVAVHDPTRQFEDDVVRMAESAAATRWSEVTVAEQEALTSAGRCQAGDVLGLIAGEVVVLGSDPVVVGLDVIARLLGVGGELVTVLLGGAAPSGAGAALSRGVARLAPHVEIDVVHVGQPGRVLSIGVE